MGIRIPKGQEGGRRKGRVKDEGGRMKDKWWRMKEGRRALCWLLSSAAPLDGNHAPQPGDPAGIQWELLPWRLGLFTEKELPGPAFWLEVAHLSALLCCFKGGSGHLSLWINQPSQQILSHSWPKEIKEFSSDPPWPQCKGNALSCRGADPKDTSKCTIFHLIHKNLGSFLYWVSKVLRPRSTLIKTQKYVPSFFLLFLIVLTVVNIYEPLHNKLKQFSYFLGWWLTQCREGPPLTQSMSMGYSWGANSGFSCSMWSLLPAHQEFPWNHWGEILPGAFPALPGRLTKLPSLVLKAGKIKNIWCAPVSASPAEVTTAQSFEVPEFCCCIRPSGTLGLKYFWFQTQLEGRVSIELPNIHIPLLRHTF